MAIWNSFFDTPPEKTPLSPESLALLKKVLFFSAVANNVFTRGSLPASERVSLTDMVNAAGLCTIFLTIVASLISLHIFDTRESPRLSRIFAWLPFVVLLLGYVGFNLALALAAQP